ncbi:hypothetical protein [Peribacillus frigoritolerans]|uniref:hypothetical protein n=1 Tax=Peribacillus frigoritolerans TaxID=450367 RepID=UPI002E202AC6|nr:hypothetical protein [Peribacillus frigoritolerans]MED3845587.1 hypothetical protein [Peribacillus frigoritolerans]
MKPFEPQKDYTKVHNALFQLYTKLPDFKPDHIAMYTVLMSYHNEQYGYAFPTKAELALRLNCGINKPARIAEVLEKYGLIRCVSRHQAQVGSNDIYYVYAPIVDAGEFTNTFREECTEYDARAAKLLQRNSKPVKVEGLVAESENALDASWF